MKKIKKKEWALIVAFAVMIIIALDFTRYIQVKFSEVPVPQPSPPVEGRVVSADGHVLLENGKLTDNDAYATLLGYSFYADGQNYSSGLRRGLSKYLVDTFIPINQMELNQDNEEVNTLYRYGADVTITIEDKLQKYCADLLDQNELFAYYDSSILILDNETGGIAAMASHKEAVPNFDANLYSGQIEVKPEEYDENNADAKKEALKKAAEQKKQKIKDYRNYITKRIQGTEFWTDENLRRLNTGSVFKAISSIPILEAGLQAESYTYKGPIKIGSVTMSNADGIPVQFGDKLELKAGLIHSVNTYYVYMYDTHPQLAVGLCAAADRMLFNEEILTDFGAPQISEMMLRNALGDRTEVGLESFGQGGVTASPLHLGMIYQAIMNDGEMRRPHIIQEVKDHNGKQVSLRDEPKTERIATIADKKTVKALRKDLEAVADNYFNQGKLPLLDRQGTIAKTGTAQVDGKPKVTWIVCATDRYTIVVRSWNGKGSTPLKQVAAGILKFIEA